MSKLISIAERWIGTRYTDSDGEYIIRDVDWMGTAQVQGNCDEGGVERPVVQLFLKNLTGGDDRLLDVHHDAICDCDW